VNDIRRVDINRIIVSTVFMMPEFYSHFFYTSVHSLWTNAEIAILCFLLSIFVIHE
jgi:hypothetical protein